MAIGKYSGSVVFSAATSVDVDISGSIQDAQSAVPALFDNTGAEVLLQITAISASTLRISSAFPITGTYTLVVIGTAPTVAPTPAPAAQTYTAPTTKKYWTYADAKAKVQVDIDIQDETFVTANELIGYFNEGIKEAESEIIKIDEDYFLSSYNIPLVAGVSAYDYPDNIYAYKERGIVYSNGSIIYDVRRFRRRNKFTNMASAQQYGSADDYRWYHTNDGPMRAKINLIPAARETAVLPPNSGTFTPMVFWYIRNANRIPLIGEYVRNWDVLSQDAAVDVGSDEIITTGTYVTGDRVKLSATGSMPGGLTAGTVYYVIAGSGYIKLATSLANARAGTAINITSVGLGVLLISIAATQTIVDNTIIDIPEFIEFPIQWAKCRVMEKEGDPRLPGAAETLQKLREQMVSTLTEAQQDDENEVEADFSPYYEMS